MKKTKSSLVFTFCTIILLFGCSSDEVEINSTADFELYVQEEMELQNIPALAVLLFKDDQILYEKYSGQSNIAQNLALANNHLFLIASISKVVTATALLQLYDNGLFELDDAINDYLPFEVKVPEYSREITFRMLLTHTSGIADNDPVLDGQYYYNQDPPVSLAYFIENYLSPGGEFYNAEENYFDFEPGTVHEYSNIGSALIGVLVEAISGKDFNTYCRENIFSPLGMANTSWRLDEISQTIVTPYDEIGGENTPIAHYTNTDFPNGGLRTTPRDLWRFVATLRQIQSGQTVAFQLLKQSTAAAMITPQIPDIDSEVGLHMFIMDAQNNLWGHDGGEQGVATIMGFHPTTGLGVIIFANQGEADLDEMLSAAYQLALKL